MDILATAQAFMAAWEKGDRLQLLKLADPQFQLHNLYHMPVGIETMIMIMHSHLKAFPDCCFNVRDFIQEGDCVRVTVQVTGTHLGRLENLIPASHALPPTGRRIDLSPHHLTLTVEAGKIIAISDDSLTESMGTTLYRQLGITTDANPNGTS